MLAVLASTMAAKAQNGGLTIDNSTNPCGVNVMMTAQEPANSATLCTIRSNQFYVPAFGTTPPAFAMAVGNFQTVIGWNTHPGGALLPPALSDFEWIGISFQFDCPESVIALGCSDGGGNVHANGAGFFSCLYASSLLSWSGSCRNVAWSPATSAPMQDVTIVFN